MFGNTRTAAPRHRKIGRALLGSAAALLALAAFAVPASSAPFQQMGFGACAGKICKFNFTPVPAGQRLVVSNVSCYLRMAVPPGDFYPLAAASLSVLDADPTKIVSIVTLVTNVTGQHDDQIVLSSNDMVAEFANARQRFQAVISFYEGQVFETRCQISGDMAKLPLVNQ